MTLKEVIDFTDGIKPNAYTTAQKTVWINECEGLVQTEVLLLAVTEVYGHRYSSTQAVTVAFPDTETAVFAAKPEIRKYGYLTFSDLAVNNLTAKILDISADGLTVTFAEDTFTPEETAEAGTAVYDGSGVELLVPAPHSKIYYAYLNAMIDFANGEYNKYQNAMQLFNNFFGEYMRWFAHWYRPADEDAEEPGYYISAYGIAVKNGYEGTEDEWLLTLVGPAGPAGATGATGAQGPGTFLVTFGGTAESPTCDKTFAQISAAYNAGAALLGYDNLHVYQLWIKTDTVFRFNWVNVTDTYASNAYYVITQADIVAYTEKQYPPTL